MTPNDVGKRYTTGLQDISLRYCPVLSRFGQICIAEKNTTTILRLSDSFSELCHLPQQKYNFLCVLRSLLKTHSHFLSFLYCVCLLARLAPFSFLCCNMFVSFFFIFRLYKNVVNRLVCCSLTLDGRVFILSSNPRKKSYFCLFISFSGAYFNIFGYSSCFAYVFCHSSYLLSFIGISVVPSVTRANPMIKLLFLNFFVNFALFQTSFQPRRHPDLL